jgi:hypothetical protein
MFPLEFIEKSLHFSKWKTRRMPFLGKIICKIGCHLFESAPRDHL